MRSLRAILTYHSLDKSDSPISVSPSVFEFHVRSLAANGIRVLPVEELWQEVRSGEDGGHAAAITFDDGFANIAVHAAPVLETFAFPSTVFVVSGKVGADNRWSANGDAGIPVLPLLDWSTLGRLAERGMRIGGHSRTHRALDRLSDDEAETEIIGGADDIIAHTGTRPSAFAYPYGATSATAAACVARTFELGVTTMLRALDASETAALLPRLDAYYLRRPDALSDWGSRAFRAHLGVRGILRSIRTRL